MLGLMNKKYRESRVCACVSLQLFSSQAGQVFVSEENVADVISDTVEVLASRNIGLGKGKIIYDPETQTWEASQSALSMSLT